MTPINSKKVFDTVTNKSYSSMTACAKDLGISRSKLRDVLQGIRPQIVGHNVIYEGYCVDNNYKVVTPMSIAVEESEEGISHNHGGPFGAVIIDHDNNVVGKGHNCVLCNNDPTAHGEVQAIRNACTNLKTYDLTGCTLYTTAYPCPMCLSAIMWANIKKVVYLTDVDSTNSMGFRDGDMYIMIKSGRVDFDIEQENDPYTTAKFESIVREYIDNNPTVY